jgi:dethiobiotin synthetase
MAGYFITGTDTEIGKTLTTLALMQSLKKAGRQVGGMKPVASGCVRTRSGLRNDDAMRIKSMADIEVPYDLVNPYAFEAAVAPHVIAEQEGINIDLSRIKSCYNKLSESVDIVVVEGVGGWRVPLGQEQAVPDMVRALALPVVMVVGMKTGCINHAVLTAEAIKHDGMQLLAWVANQVDPEYSTLLPTMDYLNTKLKIPMLGHIPFMAEPDLDEITACIDLKQLGV